MSKLVSLANVPCHRAHADAGADVGGPLSHWTRSLAAKLCRRRACGTLAFKSMYGALAMRAPRDPLEARRPQPARSHSHSTAVGPTHRAHQFDLEDV